jgi:hypothetical protein
MKTTVKITYIFNCSLERAFKSPILCDVSKIHTGYGIMPKVTFCTQDENWGKIGSIKKVYVSKSLTHKGGFSSFDKILERIENEYWKFEVYDFQSWMLGFNRFVAEWKTTEIGTNKVLVEYTYTLHSENDLLYPLNWLFANTFWKIYMKKVIQNVLQLAISKEPYCYE